jgi:ankyrin repeat protein
MSPLAHASRLGDLETMKLLNENSNVDDGSLHEAARENQIKAVATLLKHGHHVDFPSPAHGSRSVLGEVCVMSTSRAGFS